MGQTPLQSGCQPINCACTDDSDNTWEHQPRYPEVASYVHRTPRTVSDAVSTDDWPEESPFHCGLQPDRYHWQFEPRCHCGLAEDAEEFDMQGPVYPELGSYVRKAPVQAARPAALIQHLDELQQLSRELANAQLQDMLAPGDMRRGKENYPQRAQATSVQDDDDDLPGLIKFTPQFFSSFSPGWRAFQYEPLVSCEIDIEVKRKLDGLDFSAQREMTIKRKKGGVYDIDGRQVSVYWRGGEDGDDGYPELYVHESVAGFSDDDDMPLSLYLQQVANVLVSTRKGGPGRVDNMTFAELGTDLSKLSDRYASFSKDRDRAMRTACSQAAMRKAAQDYTQFGLNGMALKV